MKSQPTLPHDFVGSQGWSSFKDFGLDHHQKNRAYHLPYHPSMVYLATHLVDFLMVNVGKPTMVWFFFNVGKNGGSQPTSKANRLILLASIEQEPGDLQRQGVGLVGILQSLTSKATWKSANSQNLRKRSDLPFCIMISWGRAAKLR